jgi:predicted Zn finger-like uncharacterized protein
MILQCEQCNTRFLITDAQLGAGRRVRCAICSHEWFQAPEADYNDGKAKQKSRNTKEDKKTKASESADIEGFDDAIENVEDNAASSDRSFADMLAEEHPIPDGVKPNHDYSDQAVIESSASKLSTEAKGKMKVLSQVAASIVGVCVLSSLILFNSAIVHAYPKSLAAYKLLGISPKIAGQDLKIDRVVADITKNDKGLNVLQISGYLMNFNKGKAQKVPPLSVRLFDSDGKLIKAWTIATPQKYLGFEEEVFFKTMYPTPDKNVAAVTVQIDPFAVKE